MTPLYITLTYPANWPPEPRSWKTQLELFWKRLSYHYPTAAAIWRLEAQTRGAPHFHLMVFNVDFIPKEHLKTWWYTIVDSGSPHHWDQGVHIQACTDWDEAGRYTAKYCAKRMEEVFVIPWGRFWGVMGRQHLAFNLTTVQLDEQEYFRIRRRLRMSLGKRLGHRIHCRGDCGLWVFLEWRTAIRLVETELRASSKSLPTAVFTPIVTGASSGPPA